MQSWADVIAPVAIISCFVMALKLYLDYRIKRQLIEKDKVDENVKFLQFSSYDFRVLSNIKWGMVLIGIGVAAMLSWWFPRYISDEGTIGLMFLFAGVGFLVYAAMASKHKQNGNGNRQP